MRRSSLRRLERAPRSSLLALLGLLALSCQQAQAIDLRGHVKGQLTSVELPRDSLLRDFSDDPQRDAGGELRLNLQDRLDGWSWYVDYQLLAFTGDRLELRQRNPELDFGATALPTDDRRVFDLEHRIHDADDSVVSHRLDRFYLAYSSASTVVNIGRQAVSWGNGLIYNPVDFFNPFNPAAVDTEYKTGDDMIYAQYLFASGDDLQGVWVGRRDADNDITDEVTSSALKYHGFAAGAEYDLLLGEHFDERVLALGGALDFAEALWRADLMHVDSDDGGVTSAVLNWSYSWVAFERNLSAVIELHRNGFGIDDGDYSPQALAANPDLVERIRRGELFTLGERYLGTSLTIELHPLWQLTTTLFGNLDDDSSLLQLFSRHDLAQDRQLLLALNLPAGDDGSEFGGIDSAVPGRTLALGTSLFAQLAWYF
ncbi:MAG: hypothetical protein QNJ85_13775 [Gammaproteobacteria bacterium]|nr:hypothetical protein [Gammaproteobacteria bacterium]